MVGHYRRTLTASVSIMVVFGALLALGTPDRLGMMIAFVSLRKLALAGHNIYRLRSSNLERPRKNLAYPVALRKSPYFFYSN
jgi:hypothetical protein